MYLSYSLKPNSMDSKKFLIGTLVGGISFFLLGYLSGVALTGFLLHIPLLRRFHETMSEILCLSLILGTLTCAALLTWLVLKLGTIRSFVSGFGTGATIGFFMVLSMNLIGYATGNRLDLTATFADVVVATIMNGVVGGIIGAVFCMGTKKS
jgi:hypothetical protein